MRNVWGALLATLLLALSLNVQAGKDDLSVSTKKLKITLSKEIRADETKVDVIKRYEVMERLQKELEGQLQTYSGISRAEVEITSFRLRGGAAGFWGFSGKDVLDGQVVIKDKGKQVGRFGIQISRGGSGKTKPPTRRLVGLVQKFGEKFAMEAGAATGEMPAMKNFFRHKMR